MSARVTVEPCRTCKGGSVQLEQFQQRFPLKDGTGEVWMPEDLTCLPEHMRDEMRGVLLRGQPGNFRWHDIQCPRCQGAREYVVEHVACKIF